MQLIHVAPDHWNFQDDSGHYFFPLGGNMLNDQHPAAGTLFMQFDADDCERRFAAMQAHGLNCLRQAIGVNQVFDPVTGLKAEGMRNWQTFVTLAERYGIRLMPVGGYVGSNDWFDVEKLADDGQPLDEACAFWQAFVPEFAGHPAIFAWDLRNELLYDLKHHMVVGGGDTASVFGDLTAGWPAYLETKYGTVAMLNAHYGRWGAFDRFTDVPLAVQFSDDPGNPAAYDGKRYLNEKGYRWSKRQVDVIRAASPLHMVTSGNNGWLFPDMDLWLANGFYNLFHHDLYDFVTIHPYPAPQCMPSGHGDPLNGGEALTFWLQAVTAMARIDFYGKPVMLQEFGWYGGGTSQFLCPLPHRSEAEHADYMRTLMTTLLPHANGFINWPTCDMPAANDISNHGGLFTSGMQPKALVRVFQEFAETYGGKPRHRQAGTHTVSYSLLQLTTSRAYQDAMWSEIVQRGRQGDILDFRFLP